MDIKFINTEKSLSSCACVFTIPQSGQETNSEATMSKLPANELQSSSESLLSQKAAR